MINRLHGDKRGLATQIILSFSALVLLTTAAVGLPAIMLVRNQLEQQAWTQVSLAGQATSALFAEQQNSPSNLAALTAQRPTLRSLIQQGETARLADYLNDLQVETELDLLQVCDVAGQPLVPMEALADVNVCEIVQAVGFYALSSTTGDQVWLMASERVGDGAAALGRVVAGMVIDDQFLVNLRRQTGVEHTFLVAGQPVASSIAGGPLSWQEGEYRRTGIQTGNINQGAEFVLGGQRFYVTRVGLGTSGIVDEVALDIQNIKSTERQVVNLLIVSILLVTIVVSFSGVFLARRVSRPLTKLAESAEMVRAGDLDRPITIRPQVQEVAQLATAMEDARLVLRQTITELRQAKAWADNLLDAINEGIVTLDERLYITFFSPGAERIMGMPASRALGQHCDEVFRPVESNEPFCKNLPPPDRQVKSTVLLADGRIATLSLTSASLARPGSDQTELALVFRDVSEAEMVHRFMGEFLANITHEFRTPISALTASTELLLDQADSLDPDELYSLLNSLYMGIVGLQTLVDNLLESARLEAGRFQVSPRPIELGEIIAEAVRIMRPLVDRHGQGLVVELPARIPMVRADARRVTQVLVNLLSNANRYSPDNSEITIRAAVDGDWVSVLVADQGPGVAAETVPDLFRPYALPEATNGKSRYGAGLGLPVVKAIVEAHGGQVGVRDQPGAGSLFWFTLPKAEDS
jgi:signal transduction histidine kinase